jgi:ABC-type branched-subunit amino acid transport system ATPase component
MALELADRACVLESGRVSLEGRASELARTDLVRKLCLVREPSTGHGPFG